MANYRVERPIEHNQKLYLPAEAHPPARVKSCSHGHEIEVDGSGMIELEDILAAALTNSQVAPFAFEGGAERAGEKKPTAAVEPKRTPEATSNAPAAPPNPLRQAATPPGAGSQPMREAAAPPASPKQDQRSETPSPPAPLPQRGEGGKDSIPGSLPRTGARRGEIQSASPLPQGGGASKDSIPQSEASGTRPPAKESAVPPEPGKEPAGVNVARPQTILKTGQEEKGGPASLAQTALELPGSKLKEPATPEDPKSGSPSAKPGQPPAPGRKGP